MGNNNQTILYQCGSKYIGQLSKEKKFQGKGQYCILSTCPFHNNKLALNSQNISIIPVQFDEKGSPKICSIQTKSGFKYQGKLNHANKQNYVFDNEGKLTDMNQNVNYQGTFEKGRLTNGRIISMHKKINQNQNKQSEQQSNHHIQYICQTVDKGSYIGTSILNGEGIYYNISDNYLGAGQFYRGNLVKGQYFYPNGDYYIGEFMQGSPHGQGLYRCSGYDQKINPFESVDDKINHQPVIKSEKKNQLIKMYRQKVNRIKKENAQKQDPSKIFIYQGQFHSKMFSGKGQMHFLSGHKYKGKFKQGKFHGFGEYSQPNNTTVYKGSFYYGQLNGDCTIEYTQNSQINKNKQFHQIIEKYQGEVNEGIFSGIGTLYYANGVIYKGYFHEGSRNGPGVLIYCQNKYKCLYVMNKLVGQLKDLSQIKTN